MKDVIAWFIKSFPVTKYEKFKSNIQHLHNYCVFMTLDYRFMKDKNGYCIFIAFLSIFWKASVRQTTRFLSTKIFRNFSEFLWIRSLWTRIRFLWTRIVRRVFFLKKTESTILVLYEKIRVREHLCYGILYYTLWHTLLYSFKLYRHWYTLRKKCLHSELFWSAFSHIRTEYGEILRISPYSVRMREN